MRKRGEFSNLASLVLLVVFALLIIFVVGRFILLMLSQSADTACSQSIIKSGLDKVPNFDCKAERITISNASLESRAGGKLDEEGLDLALKRAIADEMYACWKMTGQGLVDPYKNSAEIQNINFFRSFGFNKADVLLICKIVEFEDIPDINGLLFWMTMNKPKNADEAYYDIVMNTKPSNELLDELEKKEDTYVLKKEYVVAWSYKYLTFTFEKPEQSIAFLPYEDMISPKKSLNVRTSPIVMN